MGLGPGGAAAIDTVMSRIAPVGAATTGTWGQNSRRFDRLGWLNVRDFGAAGDGATDDRAAIQAAIDASAAQTRPPAVYFPVGAYALDCTTVGLILPNNKAIALYGDPGNPTTVSTPHVQVSRIAGNAAMLTNPDVDYQSRWRGSIQNMRFTGGNLPGRIALFNRCGDAHFKKCRFGGQTFDGGPPATAVGVEFRSMFNCTAEDCHFLTMGNGTAIPATLITTNTADPGGTTAGFYLMNCEWEKNFGTDLHIGGATFETHAVFVIGGKMEGNSFTTAPMVRFHDNSHGNRVIGMQLFHTSAAGAASNVVQNGTGCNGNGLVGCHLKQTGSTAGTYYLLQQATGSFSAVGCFFDNNGNETSAWRMDSGIAAPNPTTLPTTMAQQAAWNPGGAVGAGNTYANYAQSARFSDGRAGGPFGPQLIA